MRAVVATPERTTVLVAEVAFAGSFVEVPEVDCDCFANPLTEKRSKNDVPSQRYLEVCFI
jgi:hypothetical protein